MTKDTSRREFLRQSASFSLIGMGAPLAMQLAAASAASATDASDYRAIVCLFLEGGQDSNNLVLATDTGSWDRYTSARNTGQDPINLMPVGYQALTPSNGKRDNPIYWPGVVPIVPKTPQIIPPGTVVNGTRTFAVHPFLAPLVPLFEQGRLAVLANVGMLVDNITKDQFEGRVHPSPPIPPQLFSHSDQQQAWQTCSIDPSQTGWGGLIGDILASGNTQSVFTNVTADAPALFLSGGTTNQYQVSTTGSPGIPIAALTGKLFGSNLSASALNSIINNKTTSSTIANDYAAIVGNSIAAAATLNNAVTGRNSPSLSIPSPPDFFEPSEGQFNDNPWNDQLFTIAQMIAAAPALGIKRQVFFARLSQFDTHAFQNTSESRSLAQLSQAMVYFDQVLAGITVPGGNARNQVTTFTASDFSRTFTTNGSGTDHAWGGHHLIMGGAVKGGDMYGQYPTLGIDKPGTFFNPDISGNNMIPTTSIDQYAATLARWMGASDGQVDAIFPRLGNFDSRYLGFL
jgi:uncharacterized protein (DUF1501 family)